MVCELLEADREPSADERDVLAGWHGWGSFPQVFDAKVEDSGLIGHARATLRHADTVFAGVANIAAASTLNAHYTSPAIIDEVWAALGALGVDNTATVFEPGAGSGLWMRSPAAPPRIEGVEMDPVSAAVAHWLTPATMTLHCARLERWSLHDSTIANGVGFDVAVGNVPFADYAPSADDNPQRWSLHNYAIDKAVRYTRPGGLVAVLTSRYTMDSTDHRFRDHLADIARLVTAIRLPTGAHRSEAGTDVVTDLLILQPDLDGDPNRADWATTATITVDATPVRINEWFAQRPHLILGEPALGGMYHGGDLRVLNPKVDDDSWTRQLAARLTDETVRARRDGTRFAPSGVAVAVDDAAPTLRAGARVDVSGVRLPADSITATGDSFFKISATGDREPFTARPARDATELRSLCGLRDLTIAVLDADAVGDHDTASTIRTALGRSYDRYVHRYGAINRFKLIPRPRADDGELQVRRPSMGGFRRDPSWWTVAALEDFDDDTQTATKTAIFTDPVTRYAATPEHVDTPTDAIAVALGVDGRLDDARIAGLLGIPSGDVDDALGELAFRDPATGRLEPAALYLSGLVRTKLETAATAALDDPRWERNVTALRAVLPRDLTADEVIARIGVTWIPATDIEDFCTHLLDVPVKIRHIPALAEWSISASGRSTANLAEWGVPDVRTGDSLIADLANQRATRVMRQIDPDHSVLDPEATQACADKRGEIETAFADWAWADEQRATRLLAVYNRTFNNWVEPRWDGSHMTLPGMSAAFIPRPHQRDGAWRIMASRDRGTLLAHAVGAGKTATMAIAAMEMRRLGLAPSSVAVVVPNSMLDQFAREFIQLYPRARILAADTDEFATDKRRAFAAKVATGDYDAVIMTHSAFTRVAMSAEYQQTYVDNELADVREALSQQRRSGGDARSVKKIEATLERRQAALDTKIKSAKHDARSITFEQLGVSALFIDEAHIAKNLGFVTRIDGAAPNESARALDLLMKCDWMREHRGRGSIVFATATPVSNRLSEMWTMNRFLDPAGLERAGVREFDSWAANFAKSVTALEVAPSGRGFRTTTRFAQFTNVPDLAAMFRSFADVRTATELDLPRPRVSGGQPTVIAVAADNELERFVEGLLDRAEHVKAGRVKPDEDNMLSIATDGRLAALDLRLVEIGRRYLTGSGALPDDYVGPKVSEVARQVAARYHTNKDRRYLTTSGQPSTVRGATQIVFCDQGTPGNDNCDVYAALKADLVSRGVPADAIAFIQDAKGHQGKQRLFGQVRSGKIAVMIGSTTSMGVGVNVQTRLIASHTVTAPWRPDEVEQQDGRTLRQGNQNEEVELLRYVTERSFDAYSWQTIQRKAGFVSQAMGDPTTMAREIFDDDDGTVPFALVKAIATGDPRFLEAAKLEARVTTLQRSQTQFSKTRRVLERRIREDHFAIDKRTATVAILDIELAHHTPDRPAVHIDSTITPSDDDSPLATLGQHVADTGIHAIRQATASPDGQTAPRQIAVIEGIDVHLQGWSSNSVTVTAGNVPWTVVCRQYHRDDLTDKQPSSIGIAIRNMIQSLPRIHDDLTREIVDLQHSTETLRPRLEHQWPHTTELDTAQTRLAALEQELMEQQREPAPAVAVPVVSPSPPRLPTVAASAQRLTR